MLVCFIGTPCSGKTTTAARLFADLKDVGVSSEFIPEQARWLIAEEKMQSSTLKQLPQFTDEFQIKVMLKQFEIEKLMKQSCPDGVVVADSSVLNTLLYLSAERRETKQVADIVQLAVANYDVAFLCQPLGGFVTNDPNRIHSPQESAKLHEQIPSLLARFAPNLLVTELYGDSRHRVNESFRVVNEMTLKI